jgi:hypothetical protein
MKKWTSIIGLFSVLGITFYLDSSTPTLMNEYRSSILYTPEEIEAVSPMDNVTVDAAVEEEIELNMPELAYLLEKQEDVDGYVVETYREYEIYHDENGVEIKKVPTSHLDFIRYKK